MEVGSLFFKLGFKSDGANEATKFEATTAKIAGSSVAAAKSIDKVAASTVKSSVAAEKFKGALATINEKLQTGVSLSASFVEGFKKFAGPVGVAVVAVLAAITAAISGVIALAKNASVVARELVNFTTITGLSAEGLQSLQAEAEVTGLSFDELAGSIKSMQQEAMAIKMGGGNSAGFAMLGLSPNQNPMQMIDTLKAKAASLPADRFAYFAQQVGLSEKMIVYLKEASKVEPIPKNFFLSPEETQKLNKFALLWNKLTAQISLGMTKIGAFFAPIATAILSMFDRIAWAISAGSEKLEKYSGVITFILKGLVIVGMALGSMFLLVDDFLGYLRGDDSLIGRILDKFKDQIEAVKTYVSGVIDWFVEKFKMFKLPGLEDFMALIGAGEGLTMGAASSSNIANQTGLNQNSNQTNNVNINVNGAQSPQATAKEVAKTVNKSTNQAFYQEQVPVR